MKHLAIGLLFASLGATMAHAFSDGVVFAPLAATLDAAQVGGAILERLGIDEEDDAEPLARLTAALCDRQMLLILDNFEHVVAAAPLVAELLAACPRVKALVTSRTPLHLSAEHVYPVPPLVAPAEGDETDVAALAETAAVALFLQRAAAVEPRFVLSATNAADVADICRRLDGLPLAIELAAARTRLLPPAALRARLANRLLLLSDGPRDQPVRLRSMRDAIAWSYDLLPASAQSLFRRLTVFVDGFTLEAVEAVAEDLPRWGEDAAASAFDNLAALVDANLAARVTLDDGRVRFLMLETIREFAAEQLAASGDAPTAHARHAAYVLTLAETAAVQQRRGEAHRWRDVLAPELANLRAALAWLDATAPGEALRLCGALTWLWIVLCRPSEGRQWLEPMLARQDIASIASPPVLARAVLSAADLALDQDDFAASGRWYEEAWRHYQEIDDLVGRARACVGMADMAFLRTDWDAVARYAEQGLSLFREAGDQYGIADTLQMLGQHAQQRDEYDRADALFGEALAIARGIPDPDMIASLTFTLGLNAQFRGRLGEAEAMLKESIAVARASGETPAVAGRLGRLASVALDADDPRTAQSLAEDAASLFDASPREISPWIRLVVLHFLATAVRRSGDAAQALTIRQTVDSLLNDIGRPARWTGLALTELGADLHALGESPQAASRIGEALRSFAGIADRRGIVLALETLARVAVDGGEARSALSLLTTASAIREQIGSPRAPADLLIREAVETAARNAMSRSAYERATSSGTGISLAAAVDQALAIADDFASRERADRPAPAGARPEAPFGLSAREHEVLRLVAEGHTNPEIAAALYISHKTVRNHMTSIMGKLGVESRTAAATLALRKGLV